MTSNLNGLNLNSLNLTGMSDSIDMELFKSIVNSKKIIVFDGIIGAGKTTTLSLVHKHLQSVNIKSHCIYEPVDLWRDIGALNEFYKDINNKCLEFQTFTFITRIKRIITEILDNPNADYYLLERSIFTDRYIFVEMLKDILGPIRLQMYNEWFDMWSLLLPIKIYKWVLIDTSLEESIKRICSRNRYEEKNSISLEYQNQLYQKHKHFYSLLRKNGETTIIVPNSIMDKNIITNTEYVKDICNLVGFQ